MLSSIAEKHVVPLMILSQHHHTMKGKTALFGHNHVFSAVTVLGLDVSILEAGLSNTPNSSTSPFNPDLKSHSQSIDIQDSTIELPIFAEKVGLDPPDLTMLDYRNIAQLYYRSGSGDHVRPRTPCGSMLGCIPSMAQLLGSSPPYTSPIHRGLIQERESTSRILLQNTNLYEAILPINRMETQLSQAFISGSYFYSA